MQQTFLGYVATDLRFWASSMLAILRSVALPATLVIGSFGLILGQDATLWTLAALLAFMLMDWAALVVRMARRIALGLEDTEALLDRTVLGNAAHLHEAYYSGRTVTAEAA